jgi:hypothetical protein
MIHKPQMESYSGKLATPFYLKGEQNYVCSNKDL